MDKFFTDIQKQKTRQQTSSDTQDPEDKSPKALPKGVVLGKDGKPCRSCTSFASWAAMTKKDNPTSISISPSPTSSLSLHSQALSTPPETCPPDVEVLGRSTWTLLHTISATYPPSPTPLQKSDMTSFLHLFGKLYPCWTCAEDFREWMGKRGNEPRVGGRGELMRWMCEAHNEVNRKLGKGVWDCAGKNVEERWGEGPKDGSCG